MGMLKGGIFVVILSLRHGSLLQGSLSLKAVLRTSRKSLSRGKGRVTHLRGRCVEGSKTRSTLKGAEGGNQNNKEYEKKGMEGSNS